MTKSTLCSLNRIQPHRTNSIRYQSTFQMTRAPVIALSHGGGPLPLLGDPNHEDIVIQINRAIFESC